MSTYRSTGGVLTCGLAGGGPTAPPRGRQLCFVCLLYYVI